MRKLPLLRASWALLLLCAAASPSWARLLLDRADLTYDPNQPMWHVSAHLCNQDQNPTGTILYEIWLYQDDPSGNGRKINFQRLGGLKFNNPIQPAKCLDSRDYRFKVNWSKVPAGQQYHIELVVSEWDGSKFVRKIQQPFMNDSNQYMDFIRS